MLLSLIFQINYIISQQVVGGWGAILPVLSNRGDTRGVGVGYVPLPIPGIVQQQDKWWTVIWPPT